MMRLAASFLPLCFCCLFCSLPSFSRAAQLRRGGQSSRAETGFYSYDYSRHGQDWEMGVCGSRQRQSPVDLPKNPGEEPVGKLHFGYLSIEDTFMLENNGKTYTADVSSKGYGGVKHMDIWYELMNVNIHATSEHTFDGAHMPAELHLVHKRYDNDELLIVAVPVMSPSDALAPRPVEPSSGLYEAPPVGDPGFSAVVQSFLHDALPAPLTSVPAPARKDAPLDLNAVLEGAMLYEYYGSMTAPPCAENTVWLVRAEPIAASDAQVQLFQTGIFNMNGGVGNFREVMPLRGREVRVFSTFKEEVTPPEDPLSTTTTTLAPSSPEGKAWKKADDAFKEAGKVHAYVKGLEQRFLSTTTGISETVVQQLSATIAAAAQDTVRKAVADVTAAATKSAMDSAKAHAAPVKEAAEAE